MGDKVVKKGDWISLDGATGEVIIGQDQHRSPGHDRRLRHLHGLGRRASGPWACGPTRTRPTTRPVARSLRGRGHRPLTRTEHMFFEGDRIDAVREMITARDERGRSEALSQAAAHAAGRLRRNLPGHGRAAGDHPDPGPAPARVPAPHADDEIEELWPTRSTSTPKGSRRPSGGPGRGQPDARSPGLPVGHGLSRDHRDAGPGHHRSGLQSGQGGGRRFCPRS